MSFLYAAALALLLLAALAMLSRIGASLFVRRFAPAG